MATPLHDRLYATLRIDVESRSKSNAELAKVLGAKNPLSVSQAIAKLHHDGRIRVHYTGELTPVRNIDVR